MREYEGSYNKEEVEPPIYEVVGAEKRPKIMDSVDIAWVAGIFEGEGTISFSGSYPQIAVSMTDFDVISKLGEVTGLGTITKRRLQEPYKQQWTWGVWNRRDVARLLCAISPLMGQRRRERIAGAAELLSRRPLKTGPQVTKPCGTKAAASRHRYHGEKVCGPCLKAEAAYLRRQKNKGNNG